MNQRDFVEEIGALMDRLEETEGGIELTLSAQVASRTIEQILIDKGIATEDEFREMYVAVLEQIVVRREAEVKVE